MDIRAKTYECGFTDGLQAGVMLMQAGADCGALLATIGADSIMGDPHAYQDQLGELRKIMSTDTIAESGT